MQRCALLLLLFSLLLIPLPARAAAPPESATIQGVSGHAQSYTLSCEARSAVDWAAYWGVSIREKKFLNRLPRSDNPETGFVGSPNDWWGEVPPASYGVHAAPVAVLLREYGFQAEARRGMSWDELRAEIAAGRPVIAWVVGQIWPGKAQKYTASDGQTVTVARYEHTVIVIGYTKTQVRLVDAYTGQTQTHAKRAFLASWATLGNMAITGQKAPQVTPTPRPTPRRPLSVRLYLPSVYKTAVIHVDAPPPAAYTVQRGDYLALVERKTGVSWQRIAQINGLAFPFVIYTGQVLKLK
ncbi:MAG: C39 family peptidase [Chloroflexi bacterium]|nr:C39 family peptidase [Chloroflexota bacterium]